MRRFEATLRVVGSGLRANRRSLLSVLLAAMCLTVSTSAQTGNSSTVSGTVLDPSGAVVAGATVEMHNPVSQFERTVTTGSDGAFTIPNVPFNPYHLTVQKVGFASAVQDVDVRSTVPITLKISMQLASATTTVNVEANSEDLLENEPTFHTDIDKNIIDRLPLESASSSVSSLVTLTSPGVAADSNGLFHGLGDHAENSFDVDGQQITDQQSKVFSNQIPMNAIQSLEVISGAPPAEYGDKTSLVIKATTRSGQGVTTPHGSVYTSYGSFGTANAGFDLAYGGANWGNYISLDGLNSGRFLDPPEFAVMNDKGNEENFFDRIDFKPSTPDSLQLNLGYTRSWFQNPNSYDQEFHFGLTNPITGAPLGPTDIRSKIETYNVAPTWTHLINANTVVTIGGFMRHDGYNLYPSADPFNDFAPDFQSETVAQSRTLLNAGLHSDISYVKGIHNIKVGISYEQTFLDEHDGIGIVDPGVVPAAAAFFGCTSTGPGAGPPCTTLSQFDLTTGGSLFHFNGHTDVKEMAMYVQDSITKGNWSLNLGIRGDLYNGLAVSRQPEPRVGVAYNVKRTSTVLRLSYARTLETPFNENLVIASEGCNNPFLAALVPPLGVTCNLGAIHPGFRNEFHAGFEQAFGKYLVVDAEYIWKYTHNGYDFGVVGATPITFPIEWTNSKIPGFAIRVSMPNYHGFSVLDSMSSVAARFFLPQVAGLPIIPPATGAFRIDHDERFNNTFHMQYQPKPNLPWLGFNWRFDSGLVAGATPCFNPLTATCAGASTSINGEPAIALINTISGAPLTADQEFQAGFTCNGVTATPTVALPSPCLASQFGSSLIKVPAPGTENDDHNPQRIQPRSLFDVSIGDDNLFKGDRYKWSMQLTAINVANNYTLYNFLSTFSGTHYVTPRALTAQLGFHF